VRRTLITFTALVAFLSATHHSRAQGAVGTIVGQVTDVTGAVIPGAKVIITETDTNVSRTAITGSAGSYTIPYLNPGHYSVLVEASGFSRIRIQHVNLQVDQAVRADAVLKPGATEQQVQISAQAVQLDSENASIGQLISEQQVSDLPLNGRNFTSLMILQPGAVQMNSAAAPSGEQSTRPGAGGSLSLGGGRASANQYLVDGVTINDVMYQTPAFEPSIEAIQEFKAQTETYSAEYGTSANQINIGFKSGTNQFHGTAFDFLRNDFFDARSYFDASVPILRQNDFGYSLGGPIWIPKVYNGRGRTFFFANYEGLRSTTYATEYGIVPTEAERSGQFTTTITDPVTGIPFPGNRIPASRISNFATVMNQYIPAANTDVAQGNFVGTVNSPITTDQQNYRIDQTIGLKNTIFGRYTKVTNDYITGALLATSGYDHPIDATNYQITYIRTFSPNFINQFRYSSLNVEADQLGVSVPQSAIDAFHFKGIYNPLPDKQRTLPTASITGYMQLGSALNTPWLNDQVTHQVSDSATLIKGRHTMTFGFDYRHWTLANNTTTGFTGQLSFGGFFSGDPFADYLLGYLQQAWSTQPTSQSNPKDPGSPVNIVYNSFGPFFQEDWKVTPKLTVNIGTRYDWSSVPYEEHNHWSWLDPSIPGGGLCVSDKSLITSGLGANLYRYCGRQAGPSQKMVLAPRIGFSYSPVSKWVVRSGYGLFFDTAETFEDIGSGNIYPYTVRTGLTATSGVNLINADNLFPDLSAPGPVTPADLSFYEPQSRKRLNPYVQNWSLSIEHEIFKGTKIEAYYAGSKSTHLNTRLASNQPYDYDPEHPSPPGARLPFPNFGFIVEEFWSSYANYNSLNVKVESNISNFNLVAAYTYGKSMDDKSAASSIGGDGAGWAGPMNSHRPSLDYSVSAFDIPHRLVASFTYKLPFGRGQRVFNQSNAVDALVGGWQLNGIASFQSGFPYTVNAPDLNNYNLAYGQRANLVGDPYPHGFHRTPAKWFNTAAFAQPGLGLYGNSPRDFLRGQGMNNLDASAFKTTHLGELVALELRLEAFNALNRTQFAFPDSNLPDSTFGVVGAANPGRILQLGAKLKW
jgi:carboxypeptidase family protein/TonB-dependent receptor-like protein